MIPLKDDNPVSTVPFVTYGIVAANVLVFFYMLFQPASELEGFVNRYAVIPNRLFGPDGHPAGEYSRVVTSMFLHGGFLHMGGNMLFLWVFGDNIEDRLGHVKYLLFYLLCGAAAVIAQGLVSSGSSYPMIGASGAVSGVLGAYMILFPRAGVWTFFFFVFFWQVIKVPAVAILGLWIGLQVLNGVASLDAKGGGVAWFAHVGGFAGGILLILLFGRKRRASPFRRR